MMKVRMEAETLVTINLLFEKKNKKITWLTNNRTLRFLLKKLLMKSRTKVCDLRILKKLARN